MNKSTEKSALLNRCGLLAAGFGLVVTVASAQQSKETEERIRIAAANMQDAVVVDCQLPGKLRRLGGMRTYLTPGRLMRTSAIVCRTRGGEYTLGDLASGTLSLQRWMVPAENGDPEAQYYVARIYATGMDDVPVDYAKAALWYEKAARQGFSEAKQELGYLYELGLGVDKDPLKALNLQRDASGLGEDLDYAYKIADAQALAQNLAEQLHAANGALRDSQLTLSETQEQLFAVREAVRRQELQMAGLVSSLEQARREAADADSSRVRELEQEIATVKAQLVDSQNAIFNLEQERDTARAELETQLAGGQATQLELRELIARTERAEGAAETLSAQLAEAQQRLIHSDEEIQRLQTAYREQSGQLAAESERLLEARARSQSDADAYIAVQETEIALRETRIASLESQIANLKGLLEEAQKTDAEDALRQQIATLSASYENDMAALQRDRDRLQQSETASTTQLASREARIKMLETQIRNLQASLSDAQETATEDALRQEIATLRARYENDVAALQHDRDELRQNQAAGSVQLASREARIASLEAQIRSLQARLRDAQKTDTEDALRQEIEALETRYANDLVALRHERDMLRQSQEVSSEQLEALYAESTRRLAAKDDELMAREREIASLSAESAQLRARVQQMQAQQAQQIQHTGVMASQLQAQLAESRQQIASLTMALDEERSKKSATEARLNSDRIRLQQQLERFSDASAQQVKILQAKIEQAESTIKLQDLRIATLEQQVDDSSAQLAALKTDIPAVEFASAELGPAVTVLEMARSNQEPYLGRYHALLIANQDYLYMDDLTTPIRDAMEIEKLLVNRYGFTVKVLTNATDDEIMRTLHDYSNNLTEDDNLLVYYAGRGSTPDGPPDRAYWLGVDADPELRNTWLLADHVSDKIKQIEAKRVLLVTDSCFSRRRVQGVSMAVGRGLDPERFKLLAQFKSRYVLTSGANVPVYDESGDRRHSLFAKSFLEVLRQNKNVLSGELLSHEMIIRVRERAENPDRATPAYNFLQDAGHKAGDFFFVPMEEPLLVANPSPTPDSV